MLANSIKQVLVDSIVDILLFLFMTVFSFCMTLSHLTITGVWAIW